MWRPVWPNSVNTPKSDTDSNPCTKFEKHSFNRLQNIESVAKFRNWVTSPRHAHLGGNLQSVNKNCPQSVSVRHLKSVALSATKLWHIFLLRTNWPRDLDRWPFDLESATRVTYVVGYLCANSIFVFLGLSVLDLGPRYATDRRQTDVRQKRRLMPPPYGAEA